MKMKSVFCTTVIILTELISFSFTQLREIKVDCQPGWEGKDDSCYKYFSDPVPWDLAKATCKSYGGMLVAVRNYYQNEYIGNMVESKGGQRFWIGVEFRNTGANRINVPAGQSSQIFIGNMESKTANGWWANYEPDTKNGECVAVEKDVDRFKWAFGSCEEKNTFVCQRKVCSEGSFHCSNQRCIKYDLTCDGQDDCGDMSDELNCTNQCGQVLKKTSGEIMSDNYPAMYPMNINCFWLIEVPITYNAHLKFSNFMTEEGLDKVQVYVGGMTESTSQLVATLSGNMTSTLPEYTSPNNFILVKFSTDASKAAAGFKAMFSAKKEMFPLMKMLTATSSYQTLTPPSYPNNYLGNQDYTWIITAEQRTSIVTLQIEEVDLKDDDVVIVRDGEDVTSKELLKLTSSNEITSPFIFSSKPKLYISLKTRGYNTGKGFKLQFKQGCSIEFIASQGMILSPGFNAGQYPNYANCDWLIKEKEGKPMTLSFISFDVQNTGDSLKIYNGTDATSPRLGTYMGSLVGAALPTILADRGTLFLTFKSDSTGAKKGFHLEFSVDCPAPNFNSFTKTTPASPSNSPGSQFEVECKSGYRLAAEEFRDTQVTDKFQAKSKITMRCSRGGKWNTLRIPTCEPVYCGKAPVVANGYTSSSTGVTFGKSVSYQCFSGYKFKDAAKTSVQCLVSGKWSDVPVCEAITCPSQPPTASPLMRNQTSTPYGLGTFYSCQPGYDLIGAPKSYCGPKGQYTAPAPTCKAIVCVVPHIRNGAVDNKDPAEFQKSRTFSCNQGYKLNGTASVTCGADGKFSGLPSCSEVNECDTGNGGCSQICANTEGSFMCSCNQGYKLDADNKTCIDIKECDKNKGGCSDICEEKAPGYICKCNTGRELFTQDNVSSYSVMSPETGLREGDVFRYNHTCVNKQCPTPVLTPNLILLAKKTVFRYKDVIQFTCPIGFKLQGSNTLTCQATATWSAAQPTCKAITCTATVPSNLKNEPKFNPENKTVGYKDTLTMTCTYGDGSTKIKKQYCLYNQTTDTYNLEGDDFECGTIDCGKPPSIPGALYEGYVVGGNTSYGATYPFVCDKLYTIVTSITNPSNRVISCGSDRKWDAKDMRCEGITCTDPGRPDNGYQNATSYEEGKLVKFGCSLMGYTLDSYSPIVCVKNGTGNGLEWNGTVPNCVDTQKPVISGCQDLQVDLYSTAGVIKLPSFSDNGGIKFMKVTPFYPSADIILTSRDKFLNFEFEDNAGNKDSCSTNITIKDTRPPTLTCPTSYSIPIEKSTDTKTDNFSQNPANATDASGDVTITYNPTTVTAQLSNLNIPQPVNVEATDKFGNKATCIFQVVATASSCSPLSFPVAAHTTKTCSNITNGYQCNLTCDSGYRFLDSSNAQVFSCIDNNPWDQAAIDMAGGCSRADIDAKYTLKLRYEYKKADNGALNTVCNGSYKDNIQDTMSTSALTIQDKCRGLFDNLGTSVRITVTSNVDSVSIQGSSLFTTFLIDIEGDQAVSCGNSLVINSKNSAFFLTQVYGGPYAPNVCDSVSVVIINRMVSVTNPFTDYSCDRTRKLAQYNGVAKCLLCPEGYKNVNLTNGMIDCRPCERGMFTVDGNRQVCESCASGTTTYGTGSYNISKCIGKCSAGSTSSTGLPPCSECPRNTYRVNETYCETCPNNGITRKSASTSLTDCKAPCSAGFYSKDGHEPCMPCPKSFYSEVAGSMVCKECPDSDTTPGIASNASSVCADAKICANVNTCLNGGKCETSKHTFKCACAAGYYGRTCSQVFNPCLSNPCYNKGICTQTGSTANYTCTCPPGTSGDKCETDLNNCDPYPCGSNGMCQDYVNSYMCHCKSGYKGQNCSETSDVCVEKPCFATGTNGACVKQGTARRRCNCLPGYSGDDCSTNINECASMPCLNRGMCNDLVAGYNCTCNAGYNGNQCTMRESLCKGVTCTNGMCVEDHANNTYQCLCNKGYFYDAGTKTCNLTNNCSPQPCVTENTVANGCKSNIEGFQCMCKSGFTGSKCQHNIDDCATKPCGQNSIMCTDLLNAYNCTCKEGYEGRNCEKLKDTCSSSLCKGVGVQMCKLIPNDYICECKPGYTGRNCETDIDDCAGRPCLHGSNCTDKVNGFSCDCKAGWTGVKCEQEINSCQRGPCTNGATCQNLFNDYYCKCKDNTYGKNCSQKESLCKSANPCIHGQTCMDTNGLKCMCSSEWKGDGCEIAVDYCAKDVCLNGGKCTPSLFNYTCECSNGYQGRNCDENPDNCAGVTCPGQATCVDGEDEYFCRCPLGKVGKNCDKDLDTDYMLLFSSPMKDAMAAFPYPIPLKSNKFSITFWVRFWDIGDTGNFLSIFFTESQASTKVTSRILNIDHKGLKIMNGTEEKSYTSKYTTDYNDGKWHNIAVTWNGQTGVLRYVVDSFSNGEIKDFSTGLKPDSNVWVVLGVKYDYQMRKPIINEGFRGWISQVNLYSSVLDFTQEIPQLLKTPQKVFNESSPVQLWSDYQLMSNVQRIPKADIKAPKDSCPRGFSNPDACDIKDLAKTQVKVEKCPENIIIKGDNRITQATWTTPTFSDSDTVISNYVPDSQFLWGLYPIIYQASSNAGHKALCTFDLFIQYDNCTKPADPIDGSQIYLAAEGKFHAATDLTCNSGFEFSQPTPELYTCGPIGSWDPPRLYNTYVLPPCGEIKAAPKVQVTFIVTYQIRTDNCPQVKETLTTLIRERFVLVNQKHGNQICSKTDCSDIGVEIKCTANRRRKRQTSDVSAQISIPLVPYILNPDGGGTITPEELINQLLLGDGGELDFQQQIPGAIPNKNDLQIMVTPACPEGQTVINDQCVECAAGTFFNVTSLMCQSCPINQYQDMKAQKDCKSCPTGKTTENMRSSKLTDCKDTCEIGSMFKDGSCMKCPLGFYQNMTGQFYCLPCPVDKTTKSPGATSESQCFNDCPLGQELTGAGQCQKCPVGKYRSGAETSCQPCPGGTTTAGNGSTSMNDCNLGDCKKGFKRTTEIQCEICPVNTYQDQIHQTECISCGDSSYKTDQEGSTSKTDCKFFCPDGKQQLNSSVTVCTDCPIGFYRNSTERPYGICRPCSGNFKTPTVGSVSESQCTIFKCPAGQYPVNKTCEPCPLGQYQPEAEKEECLKCPVNLSTRKTGSTNMSQCESYCESGKEKTANGTCNTCQRGYYKDNGQGFYGNCMLCPIENITASTGTTKLSDCNIRNCSAGFKLENNECVECPVGFYQEKKWQTTCMKCDAGKTTENKGADRKDLCILKCIPGKEDVNGTCTECQIGFFKTTDAAEKCKECPSGFITSGTGATTSTACSVAACPPGEFRNEALNKCEKCTYGKYQPMKWQKNCLSCGAGNTTYVKGAKDISQCQVDCVAGKENINNTCSDCEIGFYRDKVDKEQPRCLKCPGNKITASPGATKAADCTVTACVTPGEYLVEATNQCKKCPKGQYQDEERKKSCKNCPTGKTTENEGSSKPDDCKTDCRAGSQYNDTSGKCEDCPVGQYRDKTTWGCQICPDQLSTTQTGAVSKGECTKSPCKAGEKFDQVQKKCVNCPVNTYQPNANKFECIPCTLGESTSSTGSKLATDCQKKCSDATKNDCHSNAVCTNVATAKGYTCTCKDDFQGDGVNCTNKCLLGYCGNFGTCIPGSSPIQCQCKENYEGSQCQSRKDPSVSGPQANQTIIIGVVTAAALLLFIILIVVCIIVRARRRHQKRKPFLNEYDDRSVGTRMSFQNYDPYGSKPPSMGGQRLMLPSNVEKMYDNPVFREDDPAVYRA